MEGSTEHFLLHSQDDERDQRGALIGRDVWRVNAVLSAPAGMSAVGAHAHLSDLDVRVVDGLRVQADDLLHVDDVALLDVLEFLRKKIKGV